MINKMQNDGPVQSGGFPRYFKHALERNTDVLYVRHDDEHSDAVVVTVSGEREPNAATWVLSFSLFMVALGRAVEITREEADELSNGSR